MGTNRSSNAGTISTTSHGRKPLPLICIRNTQYDYFVAILGEPDWTGKKILDFGGNVGGFLIGAPHSIKHDDYWCIDLCKPALERGRKTFPRAHFVFYDRHNSHYNPTGAVNLPIPSPGQTFDFILAFSVFTHTSASEMVDLLDQLKRMLSGQGKLAFTFCDPHYDPMRDPGYDLNAANQQVTWGSNLRHRFLWKIADYPGIDVQAFIEQASNARSCTLVGDRLYVESDVAPPIHEEFGVHYDQFHTVAYIKELLPGAEIFPPVSPERQHCCVLRK
jgi:methyltransferase family protein